MLDLSHEPFYLFGCGNRPKLICTPHGLTRWPAHEPVVAYTARQMVVDNTSYTVTIETEAGAELILSEDERGIWLTQNDMRTCLAAAPVSLPTFKGHLHGALLRALHHEILVNIVDGKPLPNFLVYHKPWYRDGAMVGMVLDKTGNVDLIRDWILSLRDPFDRNNWGHEEPDNLGEVLYLVSLVSDAGHPLVQAVLDAAEHITEQGHLTGLTDGAQHPVYQTKWLKFGLERLGLADAYRVPQQEDSYAPLFWLDKRDIVLDPATRYHTGAERYPYLTWAEAHFWGDEPPVHFAADGYPLTWEAHASQADYAGMRNLDASFVDRKLSMPHTWHAAEMFLYLWELDHPETGA